MRVQITKEFYKNRDADSAYFTITVTGDSFKIDGEAFNIFSSSTFHLGDELERDLERVGIDAYDIVEALEGGHSVIDVAVAFPTMSLKEKLDTYAKTAIDLKLFSVASRLCTALESAHRADMNTPEDFGGEWASIKCDFESVDEATERASQDHLDEMEAFEGEQLARRAGGCLY